MPLQPEKPIKTNDTNSVTLMAAAAPRVGNRGRERHNATRIYELAWNRDKYTHYGLKQEVFYEFKVFKLIPSWQVYKY